MHRPFFRFSLPGAGLSPPPILGFPFFFGAAFKQRWSCVGAALEKHWSSGGAASAPCRCSDAIPMLLQCCAIAALCCPAAGGAHAETTGPAAAGCLESGVPAGGAPHQGGASVRGSGDSCIQEGGAWLFPSGAGTPGAPSAALRGPWQNINWFSCWGSGGKGVLEGERGKAGLWGGERGEGGVEGGGDGVRGGAGRGVGDFIGFPLVLKPTACLPHSGSTKTAHIYIYIYALAPPQKHPIRHIYTHL